MRVKQRIWSRLAMALILLLMVLSFVNCIYGFLEERSLTPGSYDAPAADSAVAFEPFEDSEQTVFPEIGYSKQPVKLCVPSDFEEIPGVRASFDWGWELLDGKPTERSEDLAVAAASLIQIEYYLGFGQTEDDIRALREGMGFDNTEIFNNDVSLNVDRPVTIVSSVKAPFPGEERYIVCVDVRGTSSAGDAVTDLKAAYNGFSAASSDVCANIVRYVEENCGDADPESITFFVFGHSLGGACAGLQAELLDKAGFSPERIFVYTFASPKYRLTGGRSAYPNVMNYIVSKDYVPRVPFLDGRYGTDYRYDDPFMAIYAGDALEIMMKARPRNELVQTMWWHHNSTNYLIEVGERNVSTDPVWSNALYYGARLLLQTMQLATG